MIVGFIGTGTITEALVRGLRLDAGGPEQIILSPRNAERASALASEIDGVTVAATNQQVVDKADMVCLAVRPQVAQGVLEALHFRPDQTVASLLPTFALADVARLVAPATNICRLLPLPCAAQREGPIAIFPAGHSASATFSAIGTMVELDREDDFRALIASTGLMASFFAATGAVSGWLRSKGVSERNARRYVARLSAGLANSALDEKRSYEELVSSHTTPQGLNEQAMRELANAGVCSNLIGTLDLLDRRIRGRADFAASLKDAS